MDPPEQKHTKEIRELKEELQKALKDNCKKTEEMNKLQSQLIKYQVLFTPGIQRRIETGKSCDLVEKDKSFCIALESMGPKAYQFMRRSGFPFPHPATLRKYAALFNLQPGFIEPVLPALSSNSESISKYYTLSFDEMSLRKCYELDPKTQTVMRPSTNVFVAMIRSLCAKYQQVVYYDYDKTPTLELLEEIFEKLKTIGLIPVATVCDQGTKNIGLWKEMNVTKTNPVYITKGGDKVFVFADTPHLMKNLRNHLIDTGFIVNGEVVTAAPIKRLLLAHNCPTTFHIKDCGTRENIPPD